MDTCPRASITHISKERENGQKFGTSRAHLSKNGKPKRYSPRARLKGLPPFTLIHQHYHPYLVKCDSMLEKVIHKICEFYLRKYKTPG
jgi:hypothetical protein